MSATPPRVESLLLQLVQARDTVNKLASQLNRGVLGRAEVFLPTRIDHNLQPPELGFVRLVSWLYVLYLEAGRVSVRFILRTADVYSLDVDNLIRSHYMDIQRLRTYLSHYLNPARERDIETMEACEDWFRKRAQTVQPKTDKAWRLALEAVLEDSLRFIQLIERCLRAIEADEACDMILGEWKSERDRHHSPETFDPIVVVTAEDIGRTHLDMLAFRKRFYSKWISELQLLIPPYDFKSEARKLIEHSLLHETTPVLPLTGTDIMEQFGIQPGPTVGEMLARARVLYDRAPCSNSDLLARLLGDDEIQGLLPAR